MNGQAFILLTRFIQLENTKVVVIDIWYIEQSEGCVGAVYL